MSDGIDEFKGREIDWAVGTVVENAEGVGLSSFSNANEMVDAAYEFIQANFEEEGLVPPTKLALVKLVSERLREIS